MEEALMKIQSWELLLRTKESRRKSKEMQQNHLNIFFAYEHNRNQDECIYIEYSSKIPAEYLFIVYADRHTFYLRNIVRTIC